MSDKKDNTVHRGNKKGKPFKLGLTTKLLMVLAVLFLFFSFAAPWLFTRYSIVDFSKTGAIGDTIGGIMNPFIAFAGVIATFLAFYMQVRANRLQRELFNEQIQEERIRFQQELKEQQQQFNKTAFEQRFYEMLRLHKENVNELSFEVRPIAGTPKEINGRKAFQYFTKEIEVIYCIVKHYFPEKDKDFWLDQAYRYFFFGIGPQQSYVPRITSDPYSSAVQGITQINIIHKASGSISRGMNGIAKHTGNAIRNAPHFWLGDGHSSQLGHYYRHLFQTVKFVAKQKEQFISYAEKRSYLRTLRAQLSNEEQAVLFYNSKSKLGVKWNDAENKFLTDYRMIHNLRRTLLLHEFDLVEEFDLESNPTFRKDNNRLDDYLFEFEENKVVKD